MLSPSLFTPQAWQDALEIVAYIGTDNPEAAARFVPALEVCFVAILCRLCRNSLPQCPHDPGELPYSTKNLSFID